MSKKLYSPAYIKELSDRFAFDFTKSLGQNFLIDGNIIDAIIRKADINKEDNILEIGTGIGSMTYPLAQAGKKLLGIEIDKALLPILDYTLEELDNVKIINEDFLQLDLKALVEKEFEGQSFKLVANLPYYITSPILTKVLESGLDYHSLTVMVQKEVADRMRAKKGTKDYGSLTVFINYYTEVDYLLDVPRTVFYPKPKVDSAVVRLRRKEDLGQPVGEDFFKLVRGSFANRRKTLVNSLYNSGLDYEKDQIRKALKLIGLKENVRGEDLGQEEFLALYKELVKIKEEESGR